MKIQTIVEIIANTLVLSGVFLLIQAVDKLHLILSLTSVVMIATGVYLWLLRKDL